MHGGCELTETIKSNRVSMLSTHGLRARARCTGNQRQIKKNCAHARQRGTGCRGVGVRGDVPRAPDACAPRGSPRRGRNSSSAGHANCESIAMHLASHLKSVSLAMPVPCRTCCPPTNPPAHTLLPHEKER